MLFDGKKFYYAVVRNDDNKIAWVRAFPSKDTRDDWVDLKTCRFAVTAAEIGSERARLAKQAVVQIIKEQKKYLDLAHDYAKEFDYKRAFHKAVTESDVSRLIEKIEAKGIKLTEEQKVQLIQG